MWVKVAGCFAAPPSDSPDNSTVYLDSGMQDQIFDTAWGAGLNDWGLEGVGGALDPEGAALGDVGADHRGFEVSVAEEFLDGADVGAGLEEMGGEGLSEGVGGDALCDARGTGGSANRALRGGFVEMMAA